MAEKKQNKPGPLPDPPRSRKEDRGGRPSRDPDRNEATIPGDRGARERTTPIQGSE